jgi:hypothetical protein
VRYFTDFIDGDTMSRDEEGVEFPGRWEACLTTAEALAEMVQDVLRTGSSRPIARTTRRLCLEASVRDEAGAIVFRARIALDLDWPIAVG